MIFVVTYRNILYSVFLNILRMGQKFAIFILLWISLTFNLESNQMNSYFLVFYFFTNVTVAYS
jgi:hypothetical protein